MKLASLLALPALASALCPLLGDLPAGHPPVGRLARVQAPLGYASALVQIDWDAVRDDISKVLVTSDDFWPSDYGNYGPEMIRLAWHNAGSYRTSDGRGGSDGARQRFDPERSWEDNTNLDKARKRLEPVKLKHGLGLSWGDLIQLAGYVALESMGTPLLGFCAGRIDDPDGTESKLLGPTYEQQQYMPCAVNGECGEDTGLGTTTVGLIYLNPEGPMGNPDPSLSAKDVRDAFHRMAMNDSETVALIGGGHAFGKAHGACAGGPGPSPMEDPRNPWPGTCGTGKGVDAWTSGFEGPWTANPTTWDNKYFQYLQNFTWGKHKGPGDHYQWRVVDGTSPRAPAADGNGSQDIMMLTSDISLTEDPEGEYQKWVATFASDQGALEHAFMHAWYKLTTRDMGPHARCTGDMVPPAQPWQYPLPAPPAQLADFDAVTARVIEIMDTCEDLCAASFVRLAYQCAATYRETDYLGGCDGARVRFAPESEWEINEGLDTVLGALAPVKDEFGEGLSWADLIVLTGTAAVNRAGASDAPFCGGRTDAVVPDEGSQYLRYKVTGSFNDTLADFRDTMMMMGFTPREWVALVGGEHMLAGAPPGYSGRPVAELSGDYFHALLSEEWAEYTVSPGRVMYKSADTGTMALSSDMMLRWDPEFMAIAEEYATDPEGVFRREFTAAWVKLMNADRFDGPTGSPC